MKVGIMSMQRITNYGSYLIAFALQKTFQKMGHSVEFVDFKIEPCIKTTTSDIYLDRLSNKDHFYIQKTEEFKKTFLDIYLKELGIDERNERPELDTLVIGSDEVFNCLQENPNVGYSLELFGKNANTKNIISYAASCGATTYEELQDFGKTEEISSLLKKFKSISVRDHNSKEFVEKLIKTTPEMSLDPVLLYDFDHDIIDNVTDENYIIVYGYNLRFTEEENLAIRNFADKYHKKIICLGMYQTCCDKFIPAHPLEVLAYFKKADFIFTDTFHGSIFSIKAKKPFATIIRESNKEKLGDLLDRFHLSNRKLHSLSNLETILTTPIDFTKTYEIIKKEREKAIEYLNKNLKED